MEPIDKSKLIDGIIKFFTTSKNTQIMGKTDLDTDEDLKQDAEEVEGKDIEVKAVDKAKVEEEEVNSINKIDFTELVIDMFREGQKLYSARNNQTLIKLLSSIGNKTTPSFQRLYNELQDEIKLVRNVSILDLKLQKQRRPGHLIIKNLYDRVRK